MPILGALMGFLLFSSAVAAMPANANAPVIPTQGAYSVTLTGYNAVPDQTDSTPLETASGAYSNPEVVAARSTDLSQQLPFGTIIALYGPSSSENSCGYNVVAPVIGYRVIADSMNAQYTDRLDVLFSTKSNYVTSSAEVKNAATILGICKGVTFRVVGHVDIQHIPQTQTALAAIVNGTPLALNQ
jgi:hypothetical protein